MEIEPEQKELLISLVGPKDFEDRRLKCLHFKGEFIGENTDLDWLYQDALTAGFAYSIFDEKGYDEHARGEQRIALNCFHEFRKMLIWEKRAFYSPAFCTSVKIDFPALVL